MDKTKFNVSKDIEKRTLNGIVFDSRLEMRFFRDVVLPKMESGEIINYELQVPYILQPKFIYNGKSIQPIKYVADFVLTHPDNHLEIIDTKGMPDSVAKLKRKMFWFLYPDYDYKWIVYNVGCGGWVSYEKAEQKRKENKKKAKLETNQL
ncbi:MAG: DUF1064 domain-containing protein [Oscillospiraceae bacterium]